MLKSRVSQVENEEEEEDPELKAAIAASLEQMKIDQIVLNVDKFKLEEKKESDFNLNYNKLV